MTDRNKLLDLIQDVKPPFSIDEINEFFNTKGVKPGCPACGNEVWLTYNPVYGFPSMPLSAGGSPLITGDAIEMLAMHCSNCGHIRTFDLGIFEKWKAKHNG